MPIIRDIKALLALTDNKQIITTTIWFQWSVVWYWQ